MRALFSILGLLVVVAIVGTLVKRQLQVVAPTASAASSPSAGAATGVDPQRIEQQMKQDVERALQQGAARASGAEP